MKTKVKNTKGELELREFPSIDEIDMQMFLSYFNCPVEQNNHELAFSSENDYNRWYELINSYKTVSRQIETIRKIEPSFVSLLEQTSAVFLKEKNLAGWLDYVSRHLESWVKENFPTL